MSVNANRHRPFGIFALPKLASLLRVAFSLLLVLDSTVTPRAVDADGVDAKNTSGRYREIVLQDEPVAYWRFGDVDSDTIVNEVRDASLDGSLAGHVTTDRPGPRATEFPLFSDVNTTGEFPASDGFIRVKDIGKDGPLDFDGGDSITLEAWVNPRSLSNGSFHGIVGKGRTGNPGFALHNQNYALRLSSPSGALSFLFRSPGDDGEWHRWTSKEGVSAGDGWHHVAVIYTFGAPDSVRGYIDGELVKGVWDMGGTTERAPVVDDDEVRIGASFDGQLDEVAIYSSALAAERVAARYKYEAPPLKVVDWDKLPANSVAVDVFEGMRDGKSWRFRPPHYVEGFTVPAFAITGVPKKYNSRGIQIDRSSPFLIRAAAKVTVPHGTQRILVRSRNASQLFVDDQLIAETTFHSISGSAHGKVFDVDTSLAPNLRPLARGDTQAVKTMQGDGKTHRFRFEMIVGGRGHRPELGESSVSIAPPKEDFRLLSPRRDMVHLTDDGWQEYMEQQRHALAALNTRRRRLAGVAEAKYWDSRHQRARDEMANTPTVKVPEISNELTVNNDIDRFIGARLEAAGREPSPLIEDLAFLRRATLDIIGTVPSAAQIDRFLNDSESERRSRAIDRLLDHPGWADNWMGYWQDVLAENPNLIKPKLNNSGPFRWWLHESLLDNKPFDRFVTELVRMEGSQYFGAPAGFAMATQNDAPMAAKAQIVGRAFLGLNLKCARCHDAPYHDFTQRDLFSLAAMLNRGPQAVPKTSSIPGGDAAVASLLVEVTLKPGSQVAPAWPFPDIIASDSLLHVSQDSKDERERLATLITSPNNKRFAQVIVNRQWKRYLGRGLVEPVDDWQGVHPSHPELIDYLAHELMLHDYDLKHIAKLILNSHVYQRVAISEKDVRGQRPYLFAAPLLRRMSAEQLVDSLFSVVGKPFDAGSLTLDIDGALPVQTAMNLGEPTRAWQFASLSNERDRPSLALPFAQPFVTTLQTFGWRSSRQDPTTVRDEEPSVLQPAELANGITGRRITRLSDNSRLTDLVLENQRLERLVERVYLRMLTRRPSASELALFVKLLEDGYQERRVEPPPVAAKRQRLPRGLVSWSNHLNARANEIQIELQHVVAEGDTPSARLSPDWRERMEDMIWTLMNTPEFVYLP